MMSEKNYFKDRAENSLKEIRAKKPFVNHITNLVVMNISANITMMTGARPVMGHALEEAGLFDVDSLVLNCGNATFTDWNEAMIRCSLVCHEKGNPVILDPVGIGANEVRTRLIKRILYEGHVDVIRGNAGEMGILAGEDTKVRGVDTVQGLSNPARTVQIAAKKLSKICAVGGETDYVSDGTRTVAIKSGHSYLNMLSGTGCMATSMIAPFLAVDSDYLSATVSALGMYRLAGERAGAKAGGPGTFLPMLMDEIALMTPQDLTENLPLEVIK